MRHMINGKEYEIPVNTDGTMDSDAIRRASGIPMNRPLIVKKHDGSNEVINPGEQIRPGYGEHFADMPLHRRGICHGLVTPLA